MTTAALRAHWSGGPGGELTVTTAEQVDELVARLARPEVDDAYLTHLGRPTTAMPLLGEADVPDHVIHLAVREGWGYLAYSGAAAGHPDGFTGHPVGDPLSPGTNGAYNDDYPAGSGLPLPLLRLAIMELLRSGELPTCVRWTSEDEVAPGPVPGG